MLLSIGVLRRVSQFHKENEANGSGIMPGRWAFSPFDM